MKAACRGLSVTTERMSDISFWLMWGIIAALGTFFENLGIGSEMVMEVVSLEYIYGMYG